MSNSVQLSVAPPLGRPVVGMCAGKDCRKGGDSTKVRGALERNCDVVDVKCVGVCSGPVVVVGPTSAKPAVYSKLRSKKQRALLVDLIAGDGRARKQLSDRRITKKKVVAAAVRQAKRRRSDTRRAA